MSRVSFQVVIILIFAATVFFVWDFSQRVVTNVRLTQTEKQLEQQVAQAEAQNVALRELKRRAQTNEYAEEVARRWHWARPEDIVVIPQITPVPTPSVSVPASPLPPAKAWWQDWLDFLFGP